MALTSLSQAQTKQRRSWNEGVTPFKFKEGWNRLRLYGPIYTDYRHRVETLSGKAYTEYCHGYDVEHDRFFDDRNERCDCCRLKIQGQSRYYINVLDLDVWEARPANMPPNWTPLFLADFAPSIIRGIQDLRSLNAGSDIAHPVSGAIVNIKFDPNSPSPATMYQVSLDTKNWGFPDEIKALTVVQAYPDGKRVVHKGNDQIPGAFEYVRAINTREDMVASLDRNKYFGPKSDSQESSGNGHAVNAKVAQKSAEYLADLEGGTDDAPPPRASNVKKLAVLQPDAPKTVVETAPADSSPSDVNLDIPF